MGQYRQWLHYREVDRKLHEQLQQLEEELVQLQAQMDIPEAEESLSSNTITHALAAYLQQHQPNKMSRLPTSARSLSPARQAQGSFSTSDTLGGQEALRKRFGEVPDTPTPAIPHTELTLSPDDMATFIDEHTQTAQEYTPTWWLPTLPHAVPDTPSRETNVRPAEQQSTRTNHMVQRWVARWEHQLRDESEPPKDHTL
jgi:hypothetical protein